MDLEWSKFVTNNIRFHISTVVFNFSTFFMSKSDIQSEDLKHVWYVAVFRALYLTRRCQNNI